MRPVTSTRLRKKLKALESMSSANKQRTVILNAAGRKPRTFDFGLETVGLEGEGAAMPTDDSFAVPGVPWLYAVGDVNGLGPTTHMGVYQARIASNAILKNVPTDGDGFEQKLRDSAYWWEDYEKVGMEDGHDATAKAEWTTIRLV